MAVEAIGSTGSGTSTARTEFQRMQQRLADDLAAKAAEKVAVKDKAALERIEVEALRERQAVSSTVAVVRPGGAFDLMV
jgi:ABC-type phosphate transport system ATPase subunit